MLITHMQNGNFTGERFKGFRNCYSSRAPGERLYPGKFCHLALHYCVSVLKVKGTGEIPGRSFQLMCQADGHNGNSVQKFAVSLSKTTER